MIRRITMFFLLFVLSSCNSCLHGFYGVHEKSTPINISFSFADKKINLIKNYVDSLNLAQQNDSLKCLFPPIKIDVNDKAVCLKNSGCCCYLLSFSSTKIIINGFYVHNLSVDSWLLFQEEINQTDLNKFELKFKNEVIDRFP